MLLEAETNKYCPGGNDIGAISNLITWVLNFFLSVQQFSEHFSSVHITLKNGLKIRKAFMLLHMTNNYSNI